MIKKKLISMLVSVVMIVAMFPAIVSADDGIDTFAEIQAAIDAAEDEKPVAVQIANDCVAGEDDTCIVIPAKKNIAIFLNGHTINRNLLNAEGPSEDGCVIKVQKGGTLYINPDNSTGGRITGGYAVNGGGICIEWGGALKMYGGTITANRASQNGGGIYFEGTSAATDANDTANMIYGGTVNNNMATNGGGIYVGMGADTVNFNDGANKGMSFTGNRATVAGGGMYLDGRVKGYKLSVTSNLATSYGGGVYIGKYGHYELRGTNVVKTNQAGPNGATVDNDVYLPTEKTVDVFSSLSGSSLGITVEESANSVKVTTGYGNAGIAGDPSDYFFSNNSELKIALDEQESEVVLRTDNGQGDGVSFVGSSLTLDDGQIGLNVFVNFGKFSNNEQMITESMVQFDVPGRGAKTVIDECDANHKVVIGGKEYYKFTCYLSSLQMAEEVKTRFILADDYIEDTFSVKRYIQGYMNSEASAFKGTNPYEDKLVYAIASYGHYLQPYLSELNDWSIGDEGYAEMKNIKNTTYSETYVQYIKEQLSPYSANIYSSEGINNIAFKLELASTNALIVTFTPNESTEKLSVKCTLDGKTYKAYKQKDGTYVMRISGIKIQDMANAIEIRGIAGDAGTEENVRVEITPIGYVYYALNNSESGQKKIYAMSALYEYWLYAHWYANPMSQ